VSSSGTLAQIGRIHQAPKYCTMTKNSLPISQHLIPEKHIQAEEVSALVLLAVPQYTVASGAAGKDTSNHTVS
jgi:hypothetical protein